ncbi:hypothetical protein SK128_024833, partial [Halocaridina rubra]
ECNKTFPKYYDLRRHNKLHTGEHPFMCEICGSGFTDNNRLIIHVARLHTGKKPFECSVCEKAFCRSSDLIRHMKVHDKERLFVDTQIIDQTLECTISERDNSLNADLANPSFHNQTSLAVQESIRCINAHKDIALINNIDHIMAAAEGTLFNEEKGQGTVDPSKNCNIKNEFDHVGSVGESPVYIEGNVLVASQPTKCIAGSSDLKLTFPVHSESQPYLDDRMFEFSGFGKSIPNNSELKYEPGQQPPNKRQNPENAGEKPKLVLYTGDRPYLGRPFDCKYCEKSFTKSSDLKRHHMIHTGDRPFVCSLCGTGFIEKSKLIVHTRHHTGERPFECSDCGKTFIKKSDMTNHKKTHSGERNFVCSECGKAFMKKSDLTRHTRLHTGERPYVCMVCGAAFTESGKLKKHTVVHTGEKNVQCDTCGKRFAKNSDLRRHTRIHTGERPYVCSICSRSFTYSQMYKDHMKKEHNMTPVSTSQGLQEPDFEDVVESINSSIVAPALAFIVNQKGNLDQNFDMQIAGNSDSQATESNYKAVLKAGGSTSEVNEVSNFVKLSEQTTEGGNYSRYAKPEHYPHPDITQKNHSLPIKEENMQSEDS